MNISEFTDEKIEECLERILSFAYDFANDIAENQSLECAQPIYAQLVYDYDVLKVAVSEFSKLRKIFVGKE